MLRNAINDTGKARKFVILDQNAKIQITASPWPSPNIPTIYIKYVVFTVTYVS